MEQPQFERRGRMSHIGRAARDRGWPYKHRGIACHRLPVAICEGGFGSAIPEDGVNTRIHGSGCEEYREKVGKLRKNH